MWIIGSVLVLLGLLPLLQGGGEPPAASAKPNPYAKYTRKAIVDNSFNEALYKLGAIFIAEYGDNTTLWRLTDEQVAPIVNKWGLGLPGVKFIEKDDRFMLSSGLGIDRSLGAPEPYAPPELRQRKIEGYQYWTVVYAGPVQDKWNSILRDMGIELLGSTRPSGQNIWATGKQIDQLEALVSERSFIQWVGPFHPYYRMGRARPDLPETAWLHQEPTFKGNFRFQHHAKSEETLARLQNLNPQRLSKPRYVAYDKTMEVYAEIPTDQLIAVANWPDFRSVEPYIYGEIGGSDERQNQLVAGNITLSSTSNGQTISIPNPAGYLSWLSGKGFPTNPASYPRVAIIDSGVDNGTIAPTHPDFRVNGNPLSNSRLVGNFNCTSEEYLNDKIGHGSLVASIIGAYNNQSGFPHEDSQNYRRNLGVSPFGEIVSVKVLDADNKLDLTDCFDVNTVVAESAILKAYITNNSWNNRNLLGVYGDNARRYDALTRDVVISTTAYPMLHVFAAGNSGLKGYQTVEDPGTAKNVLTVGATENVRDNGIVDGCNVSDAANADKVVPFSSRGPTKDGRAKPDIVAPGVHVQGAASKSNGMVNGTDVSFNGSGVCGAAGNLANQGTYARYYPLDVNNLQDLYTWSSGTSFAAPAVAGAAQLVYEYYRRILKPGQIPSPAMLKALLINSARYLNNYGSGDDLPSPGQGWGALNLAPITDGTARHLHDQSTVLKLEPESAREYIYHGTIADPSKPLRVTLVWTDAPGEEVSIIKNDLNLEVTVNGQIYKGNFFKKAFSLPGGTFDTVNNVENVFLPAGLSGSFRVKVRAENLQAVGVIGSGPANNQDFALVVYNANPAAAGVILGQGAVVATDAAPNGNANAIPEPNELINLTIPLHNNGTLVASNVTSSLTVSGTGAVLVDKDTTYGTIAAGAAAAPATPFKLRVAAGLPCGTPIVLTQTIGYNTNQKQTVVFKLATGSPHLATATTYASADTPKPITDFAVAPPPGEPNQAGVGTTSEITINAPATTLVGKLRVKVKISHNYLDDLSLVLTSPDGRQSKLATRRGSFGANYTNTIFDDEAAASIADGTPPYNVGSYRPETPLANISNSPLNGVWTLRVFDEGIGIVGTIDSWSLDIQPFSGYTCVPYEVNAAKIELVSANNLSARVTNVFTQPLQVRVLDGADNPLSGVVVTFTAPATSNTPSLVFANNSQTFLATTDGNGLATTSVFNANTKAGSFSVEAKVGSLPTAAVFYLTNTPDVPQRLFSSSTTPTTTVGTAFQPSLRATVLDRYDNTLAGVNVTYTITVVNNAASGTFPGGVIVYKTTSNSDGIATAAILTASTIAGQFQVSAKATGINELLLYNLTNYPGNPASITAVGSDQPRTVVNTLFAESLKVVVKDSYGNALSGKQLIYTVYPSVNGASAQFSQNNSNSLVVSTDAAGEATSGQVKANNIAGRYLVLVKLNSPPNLPSALFYMGNLPDVATDLAIIAGSPQGTDINTAFPTRLKVKLQDIFGNGISGTTVIFTAPATGASGVFTASASAVTDDDGYAEAPTLVANGITGTHTVIASGANFTANFKLTNWQACGSTDPFVVTASNDDGAGIVCGTLSRALLQAQNGTSLSFNLGSENSTVRLTGELPPLKTGVQLRGSSCNSQGIVTLDGSNTPAGTRGLRLEGHTNIQNLRVTGFKRLQIIAQGGANYLYCIKVTK